MLLFSQSTAEENKEYKKRPIKLGVGKYKEKRQRSKKRALGSRVYFKLHTCNVRQIRFVWRRFVRVFIGRYEDL